jgi:hypothetical protein
MAQHGPGRFIWIGLRVLGCILIIAGGADLAAFQIRFFVLPPADMASAAFIGVRSLLSIAAIAVGIFFVFFAGVVKIAAAVLASRKVADAAVSSYVAKLTGRPQGREPPRGR